MKILIGIFILTLGVVTLGFSQEQEKRKPSIQELKKFNPKLGDIIADIDFDRKDTFKSDSAIVFTPKEFFKDREMYASPSPSLNPEMPIYRFPDSQSRMPIEKFEDSINYTLLIKEYK
ncbi:hypothetical protein [Algoriphagus hitonicola]|uniref:Uncharacterized protein n=1 Tax=Algoriphagus hitonicola TaxID=435880 RepID=A0A1I2P065_9BACT|nr:hypothetical protein [Algoriphagus hitonicola]SFG08469.1 hypothetical protein SAMN04487988_101352 [Algoriphagus hitonicola]